MPILPCRGAPESRPTAASTQSGAARDRQLASSSIFARRPAVAATRPEVSTISCNSIPALRTVARSTSAAPHQRRGPAASGPDYGGVSAVRRAPRIRATRPEPRSARGRPPARPRERRSNRWRGRSRNTGAPALVAAAASSSSWSAGAPIPPRSTARVRRACPALDQLEHFDHLPGRRCGTIRQQGRPARARDMHHAQGRARRRYEPPSPTLPRHRQ